jgi:hypothetical protein
MRYSDAFSVNIPLKWRGREKCPSEVRAHGVTTRQSQRTHLRAASETDFVNPLAAVRHNRVDAYGRVGCTISVRRASTPDVIPLANVRTRGSASAPVRQSGTPWWPCARAGTLAETAVPGAGPRVLARQPGGSPAKRLLKFGRLDHRRFSAAAFAFSHPWLGYRPTDGHAGLCERISRAPFRDAFAILSPGSNPLPLKGGPHGSRQEAGLEEDHEVRRETRGEEEGQVSASLSPRAKSHRKTPEPRRCAGALALGH